MAYNFTKEVDLSFDEAIIKVTEELQKEGFGVLTEIDVKSTLKKKLNVDYKNYKILGACNPPLAYKALSADPEIGLLLPCNVIVFENEQGNTTVSAIDAKAMLNIVQRDDILPIAEEVNKKLQMVIERV
jgi:uncharacterized protein (DUF302 family)